MTLHGHLLGSVGPDVECPEGERRVLRCVMWIVVLVTGATVSAQTHRVMRVTDPAAANANEVSIAINPTNADNLIVVSRARDVANGRRSASFHYISDDRGATWRTLQVKNPDGRVQGDDAVAFGADGTAHHSWIAFTGLRDERPTDPNTGVFVTSSSDEGRTWSVPVAVADHLNTITPFEDKPYLGVDRVAGSPYSGRVYVAWTRFDVYGSADPNDHSHIFLSHSSDGGRSFSAPRRVSDEPGDALDSDGTVEGAVPAVGVGGEVYLVWAGPSGLVFDRSLDGGWTFGTDRIIADTPGGWDIDVDGMNRHNGMPVTGVDRSGGPRRGSLYVNWIDERHGDPDVFLIASRDGGQTWSDPVRVNDDPVGNGAAQLFTWMAVDPADGSLNVVFYDRRELDGTDTGVRLARSIDGGRTFVDHPIDLAPFPCNPEVFFGDYTGIDALDGLVVPVFMHFVDDTETAVSAALFEFRPGTQEIRTSATETPRH